MYWDVIAPMIAVVVLIVTVGGVLVLRPIAKRLADLLEVYARERQSGISEDVGQLRDILETVSARLQLLEERQDFTDRLLAAGRENANRLPGTGEAGNVSAERPRPEDER